MDSLIPIVAITSSIGIPAVVIIILVYLSHRKKIARIDLIEKALKTDTSPEVLEQLVQTISEDEKKKATPPKERHLIHATILLALGISFFALKFIIGGTDVTGLLVTGAILSMLGLAKLVIAFLIVGKTSEKP